MKECKICKEIKPLEDFDKAKTLKSGKLQRDSRCKLCKSSRARELREQNYFKAYCTTKKSECKRKGLDYNLTPEYLESIWTGVCPVFGHTLYRASEGRGSHQSAHLDRYEPNLGYVVGNVAWISGRANRIKYDASAEELRRIADWVESATTIPLETSTDGVGSTPEADAGGSGERLGFPGEWGILR